VLKVKNDKYTCDLIAHNIRLINQLKLRQNRLASWPAGATTVQCQSPGWKSPRKGREGNGKDGNKEQMESEMGCSRQYFIQGGPKKVSHYD